MIRRISIGPDYKNAMHYSIGQQFGGNIIEAIVKVNPNHYEVYFKNSYDEVTKWKDVVNMPVVIEHDQDGFG